MLGYGTVHLPKSPYVPHAPHETTMREVENSLSNQQSENHVRTLLQRHKTPEGVASLYRNQEVPNQRGDEDHFVGEEDMVIEDEIDDFVIQEVDQGKEVSNSNSWSEENKRNPYSRQYNKGNS